MFAKFATVSVILSTLTTRNYASVFNSSKVCFLPIRAVLIQHQQKKQKSWDVGMSFVKHMHCVTSSGQ